MMARNDGQRLMRGNAQPTESLFGQELVAVPIEEGLCVHTDANNLNEEEQFALAIKISTTEVREDGEWIDFHALSHVS